LNEPFCASFHLWNSFMNRHSFSSPVVITIEAADGGRRQYPIKDLTKALAVMRWYGIRQLAELRARSPGIWLIAAAALACAHEHPDQATIEHARQMFMSLAKAAGILAGM
jgi:hypothetical protein